MLNVSRATFGFIVPIFLTVMWSGSVFGQLPLQQPRSLVEESDAMRRLLIEHYSQSELFGQLLSKNSKIRGAARRLNERNEPGARQKDDAAGLDQLLFDLETMIEQANFQGSIKESDAVSKQLGVMIGRINSLKTGNIPTAQPARVLSQGSDPGGLVSVVETEFAPLAAGRRPEDLNAPLIMGTAANELPVPPQLEFVDPPISLENANPIEVPQPNGGLNTNGIVELPDLTIPSPDIVQQALPQTVLRPLSFPQEPQIFDRNRLPHLEAPAPRNYGNNVLPSRPRFTIPIQFEFHSFNPGGFFGYQPYGGFPGFHGFGGAGCHYGW